MKESWISSTLKSNPKINGLLFSKIKQEVLGKDYDLSLVFVGKKRIRTLNRAWRKKDYATDILSFEVSAETGEIFICPEIASKKAKGWDKNLEEYLPFVFVHGLFHLKGMEHGSKMDSEEKKIRDKFKI